MVFENGETGTLSAKDDASVGKNLVHEYQLDGEYVNFDVNENLVVNSKIVTSVGTNAVSFANANNINQGIVSYPSRGAQVWNVEDSSNVFSTNLRKNDLVGLVLDDDGNIVTAFVYDRQDDDMVPDYSGALTVSAGTLDLSKGEWTGASQNATLSMVLNTLPSNVEAKLKVEETGEGTTGYSTEQVVTAGNLILYTAGANENGGTIKVTLTLKDTNTQNTLVTRVVSYEITVKNDSAPVSKVTVAAGSQPLTMGDLNGEAYAATTNDTLKVGDNTLTTTGFAASNDEIKITIAATDGESAAAKLEVVSAPTGATSPVDGAYTSGSDITFSHAGEYKLKLTVTTSKTGLNNTVTEYNLTVNVGLAAGSAGTSNVTTANGAVVTNASSANASVTYADTAEEISLAITQASATTITVTDVQTNGLTAAGVGVSVGDTLTSGTPQKVYTVQAADGGKTGTIAITVTVAESGKDDVVTTYTISVSCNQANAPAPTVEITTSTDSNIPRGEVTLDGSAVNSTNVGSGESFVLKYTAAAGTTVTVSVSGNIAYDADTQTVSTTGTGTDGTVTFTVKGDGYQTAVYTFQVDVTA